MVPIPGNVLVICGPTASGKTALGVALAHALKTEVISADSMQVYRGMDIGTAKPTLEEQGGIPHHMIDVADPREDYSVARYVEQAIPCVDKLLAAGKLPILVGGTGLYIDSLLQGRQFAPFPGRIRSQLTRRLQEEGAAPLYEELRRVDPERAQRLHLNDEKRILRALEVYYETGRTLTDHDRDSRTRPPRYQAHTIFLNWSDRADLWRHIDLRVDRMVQAGLVEEVRTLLHSGVPPAATAMQAIGYKELTAALAGEESLDAALAQVKLRSRQYAKRQVTWFRRSGAGLTYEWKKNPDFGAALRTSTEYLHEHGLG